MGCCPSFFIPNQEKVIKTTITKTFKDKIIREEEIVIVERIEFEKTKNKSDNNMIDLDKTKTLEEKINLDKTKKNKCKSFGESPVKDSELSLDLEKKKKNSIINSNGTEKYPSIDKVLLEKNEEISDKKSEKEICRGSKKNFTNKSFDSDYLILNIPEIKNKFLMKNIYENNNMTPQSLKELQIKPSLFVKINEGNIYDNYKFGKKLGKGGFGQVFLVLHKKSGLLRALKVIPKVGIIFEDKEQFFYELHVLKEIDHPNIVKILELFEDEKHYYLISEYYTGGNLFEKIKNLKNITESKAAEYIKSLLSALNYCHEKNIVHRDVKAENLVFDSQKEKATLKLIDFGASKIIKPGEFLTKFVGSPHYIAPEVLKKKYNEKCDIWSTGVLLFIMLTGSPPFGGKSSTEIFKKILLLNFDINFKKWTYISESAKVFLSKMLESNIDKRVSAKTALLDPWLQKECKSVPLDPIILKNLENFHEKNKLRSTIFTFIASQIISTEEKQELYKCFCEIDKDKNGRISKEELIEGYYNLYKNKKEAKEKVEEIMKIVDFDCSGDIDFTEFLVASLEKEKLLNKKVIKAAFKVIDLDGNGYISKDELRKVLYDFQESHWNYILSKCDMNKDGKISLEDLTKYLLDINYFQENLNS